MWKRRKFDGGSDLEGELRSHRASAPEELVDRVTHRIAAERRVHQRAWSRVAFASAVAVFMLGTFASFGGLSYAASGATGTFHAVKQVASGKLLVSTHKSSASDEYGKTPPKQKPAGGNAGVQASLGAGAVKSSGTLPFTGLSLAATLLLSLAMIASGLALRRRERRN
jgi:peptidoglycan/LPS O-acetylase OafA/YrhL